MTDLFNNSKNNYVDPGLAPCIGQADDKYLEFVKDGIGIVLGTKTLSKIDFGSFSIPVNSYSNESKILKPGEISYIPGLSKGLRIRQQGFTIPVPFGSLEDPSIFKMDVSIAYYKNFRYYEDNIQAISDPILNISIEDAMNIQLGSAGIMGTSVYDSSVFKFRGTQDGYNFEISNVSLEWTEADPSLNIMLEEDSSLAITYAKYPNGGMQGIIMKGTYPAITNQGPYDNFIKINHVSEYVTLYETVSVLNAITEVPENVIITSDKSTAFGNGIGTPTITGTPDYYNQDLTSLTPEHVFVSNSVFIESILTDSSIFNESIIADKSQTFGSLIQDSWINAIRLVDSVIIDKYDYSLDDVSLGLPEARVTITGGEVWDSSINNAELIDCSIFRCFTQDVSLSRCTIYNSDIDPAFYVSSLDDNRILLIDPSIVNDLQYDQDTSTYYKKVQKTIDVGMNGNSTDTVMSAGDYLDWITTNEYWHTFGGLYNWVTAADATQYYDLNNLNHGFYVYNPQVFEVQIDYMITV